MACAVDESARELTVAPRDVEDAVPYNARPAALANSPFSACPVPFYPVRYKSDTKIGPAHLGEPVRFLCAPGERTFYRVKVPSPPGSGKG